MLAGAMLVACGGGNQAPEGADARVVEGRIQLAFDVAADGWKKAVLFEECAQNGQPEDGLGEADVAFVPNDRCLIRLSGMEIGTSYFVPLEQPAELDVETGKQTLLSVSIAHPLVEYVEALSADAVPARVEVATGESGFVVSAPARVAAAPASQCTPYRLEAAEGKPLVVSNDSPRLLRVRYVYISESVHGPSLPLPSGGTFKQRVEMAREELCERLEFPDPVTEEYLAGLSPVDGTVLERLDPNDDRSAPKRVQLGSPPTTGQVLLRCDYICKKCGETEPTEAQDLEEMKPEIYAEVIAPPVRVVLCNQFCENCYALLGTNQTYPHDLVLTNASGERLNAPWDWGGGGVVCTAEVTAGEALTLEAVRLTSKVEFVRWTYDSRYGPSSCPCAGSTSSTCTFDAPADGAACNSVYRCVTGTSSINGFAYCD